MYKMMKNLTALFLVGTTLCQGSYDTDAGFIEGTGYMDQSRNYGYVYNYCGNVRNDLGSVCCENSTTFQNLIRDTGYDVKCECFWVEKDICKKQVNVVLACITPFVVLVFWLVVGVLCGKNGVFIKCSWCLDPCDFYNLLCKKRTSQSTQQSTQQSTKSTKSTKSSSLDVSNASSASVASHKV